MSKLFFLLCCLPIILSAGSTVTISGTLEDPSVGEVGINLPFHHYRIDRATHWTEIDTEGRFSLRVELAEVKFAFLRCGDRWIKLLLRPGSYLEVQFPAADDPAIIHFSGPLGPVNQLLQSLHCGGGADALRERMLSQSDPLQLWQQIDRSRQRDLSLLLDFSREHPERAGLTAVLEAEINYYHQELFYQIGKQKSYVFPIDSTFDKQQWLNLLADQFAAEQLQNESALNSLSYFWYLEDFFDWEMRRFTTQFKKMSKADGMVLAREYLGEDPATLFPRVRNDKFELLFKQIIYQKYLEGQVLEKALAGNLYTAARLEHFETLPEAYQYFKRHFPRSPYLPVLEEHLQVVLTQVVQGRRQDRSQAYEFIEAEAAGWCSLTQVLEPYRGQVVLVDLWYSTCGSCREEFRHLPELRERFAGQELTYLYISIDRPGRKDHWRETARYFDLSGRHVLANAALRKDIWQQLAPREELYPSYFLVDRSGTIVVPHAPPPSKKQLLYPLIDQWLATK